MYKRFLFWLNVILLLPGVLFSGVISIIVYLILSDVRSRDIDWEWALPLLMIIPLFLAPAFNAWLIRKKHLVGMNKVYLVISHILIALIYAFIVWIFASGLASAIAFGIANP